MFFVVYIFVHTDRSYKVDKFVKHMVSTTLMSSTPFLVGFVLPNLLLCSILWTMVLVLSFFCVPFKILCDNTDRPIAYWGWHITQRWKALTCPRHFTNRGGFGP